MADRKISQLTEVPFLQPTDVIPISRGTDTFKVTATNFLGSAPVSVNQFVVTILPAAVLTLNSVPVELIAAPGAGLAIDLIDITGQITYNTTTYLTELQMEIIIDTASWEVAELDFLLGSTASTIQRGMMQDVNGINQIQLVADKALNIMGQAADPTAGDSTIVIYGSYRVIALV